MIKESICKICTKYFKYNSNERARKYCSRECYHKSRIGIPVGIGRVLSVEVRKKISEKRKGSKMPPFSAEHRKKLSEWQKGKPKRNGWKHSIETRTKISKSHLGEKNPQWKGGISPINDRIRLSMNYKLWRTAVFERDKYTCILCGDNRGGNLQADHIKRFCDFPELRFDINNGRTLCIDCHRKTDTYGNRGRNYSEFKKAPMGS